MTIISVYGDYRFSPLAMPRHPDRKASDTRLSAEDMLFYMEKFADTFLKDHICYNTEVINVRRPTPPFAVEPPNWVVTIRDKDGVRDLGFDRIVLCTGVNTFLLLLVLDGSLPSSAGMPSTPHTEGV